MNVCEICILSSLLALVVFGFFALISENEIVTFLSGGGMVISIIVMIVFTFVVPVNAKAKAEPQHKSIEIIYLTQEGKYTHDVVNITTSDGTNYKGRFDFNNITIGDKNEVTIMAPEFCDIEITNITITQNTAEKLGIIQTD